jgi:hypothetical protein
MGSDMSQHQEIELVIAMQSRAIALQFGTAALFESLVCVRKPLIQRPFFEAWMIRVLLLDSGNDRVLAGKKRNIFFSRTSVKQKP